MLSDGVAFRDSQAMGAGLLDASPKVQAAAVTILSQALSVPILGAETRAAILVSPCCHMTVYARLQLCRQQLVDGAWRRSEQMRTDTKPPHM